VEVNKTQRACGAGGSIKPRVQRSGTLGSNSISCPARVAGDRGVVSDRVLSPVPRARIDFWILPRVPLRSMIELATRKVVGAPALGTSLFSFIVSQFSALQIISRVVMAAGIGISTAVYDAYKEEQNHRLG